jgi:hypothetical protein
MRCVLDMAESLHFIWAITYRMKHKQEVSSLKSNLQKLQLESKNGGKNKDLATKEIEALKWVVKIVSARNLWRGYIRAHVSYMQSHS